MPDANIPEAHKHVEFLDEGALSHDWSADQIEKLSTSYIRHAPVSLAIRELNRLLIMQSLIKGQKTPVLDVGCGDGKWWTLIDVETDQVYGIDISQSEVKEACQRIHSEVCDISTAAPFKGQKFKLVVGNCSLEHIRDITSALQNMRKACDEDGQLIIFVPSQDWFFHGNTQEFLLKYMPRLSMMISGAVNGFFQHWHLYDANSWISLLENNGWQVTRSINMGNRKIDFLFRLFLPQSLPAFLVKSFTGVYPNILLKLVPNVILKPISKWVTRSFLYSQNSEFNMKAYEYAIVARAK